METKITLRNGGSRDCIDDHDLAALADWAGQQKRIVPNKDWKTAFALIGQGADLLLRRRALATQEVEETTRGGQ